MQNYYQLFGVPNFADPDEIRKAYDRMYAELFAGDKPLANIPKLKELKEAFDLLKDPEKRLEYDNSLRDFLERLEKRFEEGTQALEDGRYKESIEIFKECLAESPYEPDFYEALGLAYQLDKRIDEAAKVFQQGLQLVPTNPRFHWYLGGLFRAMRDDDKADTHYLDAAEGFKKIVEIDPRNVDALEMLADIYAKMKWFDEAGEIYVRLIEQFPYKAEYHRDFGSVLYELDELEAAEEQLLEALRIDDKDASAMLFLGLVYYKRRLLSLAVQTIEASIQLNSNQPEAVQLVEKIREVQAQIGRTVEEITYQPEPDAVVEGTVKWYNPETGVGVLTAPEYAEVFLHYTALQPEIRETIAKGDMVRFGVVKDAIGPIAVQVEKLTAASDSDTQVGKIIRYDPNLRIGVIETPEKREIIFPFSALSQDLMETIETGIDVLFETKAVTGLSDAPIEQAINVRKRKKKAAVPIPAK